MKNILHILLLLAKRIFYREPLVLDIIPEMHKHPLIFLSMARFVR